MTDLSHTPFEELEFNSVSRGLTETEQRFLTFLRTCVEEGGFWPSYHRIRVHFGWSSLNRVTQMYRRLYAKGWIKRKGHGDYQFAKGRCPHCGQPLEQTDNDS